MPRTRKPGPGVHPRFRSRMHEVDDGALCGTVTTPSHAHRCRVVIAKNRATIHGWSHNLEPSECGLPHYSHCPDHEEKR